MKAPRTKVTAGSTTANKNTRAANVQASDEMKAAAPCAATPSTTKASAQTTANPIPAEMTDKPATVISTPRKSCAKCHTKLQTPVAGRARRGRSNGRTRVSKGRKMRSEIFISHHIGCARVIHNIA
jgi:hypothetical protein